LNHLNTFIWILHELTYRPRKVPFNEFSNSFTAWATVLCGIFSYPMPQRQPHVVNLDGACLPAALLGDGPQ